MLQRLQDWLQASYFVGGSPQFPHTPPDLAQWRRPRKVGRGIDVRTKPIPGTAVGFVVELVAAERAGPGRPAAAVVDQACTDRTEAGRDVHHLCRAAAGAELPGPGGPLARIPRVRHSRAPELQIRPAPTRYARFLASQSVRASSTISATVRC